MSPRSVVLEAVTKRFTREHAALTGFALDVASGASLALLGPSGSGKTTALRLVAGLEAPDAGTIRLGSTPVAGPGTWVAPHRRGVGLVFQEHELWPHRTTAENIAFGLPGRPRGRSALEHPRVRQLAERLGIEGLLARTPDRLSGGERQRAALARTLAPAPDVLLLDEPLAALDAARRADLRGLLRSLTGDGRTTTLVVTHDPDEALALGDRVAVLAHGRVVEVGAGQALYRAPRSVAGARALGEANVLAAAREGDAWRCALGLLPALRADDAAARLVLLRPDQVHVLQAGQGAAASGLQAKVLATWARRGDHGVRLALGDLVVVGVGSTAPTVGSTVSLDVRGPVAGLEDAPATDAREHAA
jgi:iron(III) transport system ATP-binding protein